MMGHHFASGVENYDNPDVKVSSPYSLQAIRDEVGPFNYGNEP